MSADWLQPSTEQEGLRRYVDTLRERARLIVLTMLATTLVAAIYVATADKVYKAQALLTVSPVRSDDPTYNGLNVIRDSGDPTRSVQTAARLVHTPDVARRAAADLSLKSRPESILRKVQVDPVADSQLVAVTAKGPTAAKAAALANGFGVAAVEVRTRKLREQIQRLTAALDQRIASGALDAATAKDLALQRARLETIAAGEDPTIGLDQRAEKPLDASSPRTLLSLFAGLFGGLVLGLVAAFGSQVLDPRLRREQQLRDLYRLRVLTRVPTEGSHGIAARATDAARSFVHLLSPGRMPPPDALSPTQLSPATIEAYRALRMALVAARPESRTKGERGEASADEREAPAGRSILVTSASASEGKTTTAINLATSLAYAGHRVILIEADLRRPAVGKALGVGAPYGIVAVLLKQRRLSEALVTTRVGGPNLQLLLVNQVYAGDWVAEQLSLPGAQTLVDEARRMADYVIIDSPPLSEVVDALPLARRADDVLLVIRMGRSQLGKLTQLGELLEQQGVTPTGIALIGVGRPSRDVYYYTPPERKARPRSPNGKQPKKPAGGDREPPPRRPRARAG